MRVGIIDLGTNSVRFDVHQIGPGGKLKTLHREKLMVRLGQGVFIDAKLDPTAIRRTLQAFLSFQKTAADLQCEKIVAFGTSALREAADTNSLIDLLREKTGIEVRVISGPDEAKIIAKGIIANEPEIRKFGPKKRYALIDIGGGSTEISICQGTEVLFAESFPLGTARLQQVFLKRTPPEDVEPLRRYIRSQLLPRMIADHWGKVDLVIGSSGTVRALSKVVKMNLPASRAFERSKLKPLVKAMCRMTTSELLNIHGMESKRVDMILSGAILFEECLAALGAKKAIATEFALRDGILEEELELSRRHKATSVALHLDDFYAKAQRLGIEESHFLQVVVLAEKLFDSLRPLHRLTDQWKAYLTAAAILHDAGEAVSPTHHEKHSYYIVRNADFPSMNQWEAEFIGHLCLYHRGGKIPAKPLPFQTEDSHPRAREAFVKLLAILRVADALDRGHQRSGRIRRVKIGRQEVHIGLYAGPTIDLELLRVEQKKEFFETVFSRKLIVTAPKRQATQQ